MPPPASRWASTLASTGAPAATATPARRATSPGLAAGSRPTLLSPHTTRSGRAPAGRERLSRSLAENRSSTGPTTPGWTNATRTVPAGGGRRPQRPEAQRGQGEGDRRRGRRRPGRAGDPPADGDGHGHVDRHQQEAQPPDAADGGHRQQRRGVPLAGPEQPPGAAQPLPGAQRLAGDERARDQHHRGGQPPRPRPAGAPEQRPGEPAQRQPEHGQEHGQRHHERPNGGDQEGVDGQEEPGPAEPGPDRRLAPAGGGDGQQQHRDQADQGQPPPPGTREGQGQRRPQQQRRQPAAPPARQGTVRGSWRRTWSPGTRRCPRGRPRGRRPTA